MARKSSIEQQFVIPQPLSLQGADLRIRGRVQSGGVLENRAERWVWRGADKGFWLGQVRVYDAQGTILPSRLEVSQGETAIVIDGQGLAQAIYPVVVDPEIGFNDFRISDMGPDGDWLFEAYAPAVAYNSTNNEYLVVWWGDDNTGKLVDEEYEIFGQRIDGATGAEIGVNDFRISDMGPDGCSYCGAYTPAVAANNANNEYLVVWEGQDVLEPQDTVRELEIYGQRWSTCGDGVVDNGEECDSDDTISFRGVRSCTADCKINLCGNGVVDDDEDCDVGSGNGLPGSPCTLTCQHPSILNLERLQDLVASCEICPPQVKAALLKILSRAQAQLGKKGNARGTIKTLQQFTKKVQQFLNKRLLPDAEGRQLQVQAEVIIAQLHEQLAKH